MDTLSSRQDFRERKTIYEGCFRWHSKVFKDLTGKWLQAAAERLVMINNTEIREMIYFETVKEIGLTAPNSKLLPVSASIHYI
jgi:hypothetical protein